MEYNVVMYDSAFQSFAFRYLIAMNIHICMYDRLDDGGVLWSRPIKYLAAPLIRALNLGRRPRTSRVCVCVCVCVCAGVRALSVQKLIRKIYIPTQLRFHATHQSSLPLSSLLQIPQLLTRYLGGKPIYNRALFRDSQMIPETETISSFCRSGITHNNDLLVGKNVLIMRTFIPFRSQKLCLSYNLLRL